MADKAVSVEGGEENNNDIKIREPPASFRSGVWKHFGFRFNVHNGKEVVEKEKTVCKLCHNDVSYKSGNTSNMSTHLKRKHGIGLSSTVSPSASSNSKSDTSVSTVTKANTVTGQLRLQETFACQSKFSNNSPRARAITMAIAGFIAKDMRPYSVIENIGFQHLLKTLEPRYSIPSRAHFSTKIMPTLGDLVRGRVKENLKSAEYLGLTTDGWTSRSTQSFITVTAHFVDQDYKFANFILQTRQLKESHTAANLAKVLEESVNEWGLKRDLPTPVTTDNASNIVAGISLAEDIQPHIRCFAHTLNLATQRGINVNQVDRVLGRVRRVVSFFHKSTTATSVLKSKQELLELPQHKLIMDVPTRWNSSYDMAERYVEQQPAIFATLMSKDVKKNVKDLVTLTDDDNGILEDMIRILKPIKTVTTLMCDTKHPTLSLIHPLKELLTLQLKEQEQDNSVIKAMKAAILKDLRPRYTDPDIYNFLLQSSALDPRFKTLPYISEEQRREVFHSLTLRADQFDNQKVVVKEEPIETDVDAPPLPTLHGECQELPVTDAMAPPTLTIEEPPDKRKCRPTEMTPCTALDDLFGDVFVTRVEAPKSATEQLELEIINYKSEASIAMSSDPLAWWNSKKSVYPKLSKMAKYYLSIPATSVPSERVFSTAGDIVTAQRAALSPEHVDLLIFLKSNLIIPDDLLHGTA